MAILPNPPRRRWRTPETSTTTASARCGRGRSSIRASSRGYVRDLCVILERIAPGEQIPLHRHAIDEAIVVESGDVELQARRRERAPQRSLRRVLPGREIPHGARNLGLQDVVYTAFFPSTSIDIEYLERNPAPGTEDDSPQPAIVYDARS